VTFISGNVHRWPQRMWNVTSKVTRCLSHSNGKDITLHVHGPDKSDGSYRLSATASSHHVPGMYRVLWLFLLTLSGWLPYIKVLLWVLFMAHSMILWFILQPIWPVAIYVKMLSGIRVHWFIPLSTWEGHPRTFWFTKFVVWTLYRFIVHVTNVVVYLELYWYGFTYQLYFFLMWNMICCFCKYTLLGMKMKDSDLGQHVPDCIPVPLLNGLMCSFVTGLYFYKLSAVLISKHIYNDVITCQ